MKPCKAFVVAVMLVAVAANPVAAMMNCCGCCRKADEHRSCCQSARAVKEQRGSRGTATANVAVHHFEGCCCVDRIRAAAAFCDSSTKTPYKKVWHDAGVYAAEEDSQLATCSRVHQEKRSFYTGPPLLALYCAWLK
jgi:hypothetical protein